MRRSGKNVEKMQNSARDAEIWGTGIKQFIVYSPHHHENGVINVFPDMFGIYDVELKWSWQIVVEVIGIKYKSSY